MKISSLQEDTVCNLDGRSKTNDKQQLPRRRDNENVTSRYQKLPSVVRIFITTEMTPTGYWTEKPLVTAKAGPTRLPNATEFRNPPSRGRPLYNTWVSLERPLDGEKTATATSSHCEGGSFERRRKERMSYPRTVSRRPMVETASPLNGHTRPLDGE